MFRFLEKYNQTKVNEKFQRNLNILKTTQTKRIDIEQKPILVDLKTMTLIHGFV